MMSRIRTLTGLSVIVAGTLWTGSIGAAAVLVALVANWQLGAIPDLKGSLRTRDASVR